MPVLPQSPRPGRGARLFHRWLSYRRLWHQWLQHRRLLPDQLMQEGLSGDSRVRDRLPGDPPRPALPGSEQVEVTHASSRNGRPRRAGLTIGAVAERSRVPVKTIRFYCDQGLLRPIGRSEGRFRLFDETVFDDLALIRTLRALEMPLLMIGDVLEARRSGLCSCDQLQETLQRKAGEIEARIADLRRLQQTIAQMLGDWQRCGGRSPQQAEP